MTTRKSAVEIRAARLRARRREDLIFTVISWILGLSLLAVPLFMLYLIARVVFHYT